MDKYLYRAYMTYINMLKNTGYVKESTTYELLVITFIYKFFSEDYRMLLKHEDLPIIEKALNCLYNKNCLLPTYIYNRMSKLQIGRWIELSTKLNNINSSINILDDKVDTIESTEVIKSKSDVGQVSDIVL